MPASAPSTPGPGPDQRATSPLEAYDADVSSTNLGPHQVRGWSERPRFETEDYLLFVPRAVLFVPTQTLRFVFFPLRKLLGVVDKYAVVEHVQDLLYNDARTAGILPTVSFQTGHGLSLGAKVFHTDLLGHDEKLALSGAFGGIFQQAYQLSFEGDRVAGSPIWLETVVRYEQQPSLLFYGIGDPPDGSGSDLDPRSAQVATRFQQERFLACPPSSRSTTRA